MSKSRDVTVKTLSSHLLQMKFMKRSALNAEEEEATQSFRKTAEHWEVIPTEKMPDTDLNPNFEICEGLCYGRMSFKGFNPAIEKLMVIMSGEELKKEEDQQKAEDEEFAEEYAAVSRYARKFAKKRKAEENAAKKPGKNAKRSRKDKDGENEAQ